MHRYRYKQARDASTLLHDTSYRNRKDSVLTRFCSRRPSAGRCGTYLHRCILLYFPHHMYRYTRHWDRRNHLPHKSSPYRIPEHLPNVCSPHHQQCKRGSSFRKRIRNRPDCRMCCCIRQMDQYSRCLSKLSQHHSFGHPTNACSPSHRRYKRGSLLQRHIRYRPHSDTYPHMRWAPECSSHPGILCHPYNSGHLTIFYSRNHPPDKCDMPHRQRILLCQPPGMSPYIFQVPKCPHLAQHRYAFLRHHHIPQPVKKQHKE